MPRTETRLLEGEVIDLPQSGDDSKVRRLEADLRAARLETQQAQNDLETAQQSVLALRQQLMPLHRALKAVFGEIEMVVGDEPVASSSGTGQPSSPQMEPRVSAVWNSWKQKLSTGCGKVIDALMVHQDLNTQQLAIATGMHRTSVPKIVHELNKAGLINKNGGRFSLKQL